MAVRVSPVSRTAALLIIAVGAFTLVAGLVTGVFVSELAGVLFIVLGVALHRLLLRFTRKLNKQVEEARSG
jgi:membrane protein implicated in regulation of membrane protease activity